MPQQVMLHKMKTKMITIIMEQLMQKALKNRNVLIGLIG